jgi:hypothetical protein
MSLNLYNIGLFEKTDSLNTGLLAYWNCDDVSGNLIDASSNGNDMTKNGSPTVATGIIGSGIRFPGTTAVYYEMADAAGGQFDFGTNVDQSFSVSYWMYWEDQDTNAFQSIVAKMGSANPDSRSYMNGPANDYRSRFFTYEEAAEGGSSNSLYSTTYMNENEWYHIVHVYDHSVSDGTKYVYVNGELEATVTTTAVESINSSDTRLTIGNRDNVSTSQAYEGILDSIAIWDRALTDTEVLRLYNGGKGRSMDGDDTVANFACKNIRKGLAQDLVYYWPMGDYDGREIITGFNMSDNNTVQKDQGHVSGQASLFSDAANENYTTTFVNLPELQFDGSYDFSFSLWFKITDMGTSSSLFGCLWDSPNRSFLLWFNAGDDDLGFYVNTDGATSKHSTSANGTVIDSQWHHAYMEYDSTADVCRLVLDGVSAPDSASATAINPRSELDTFYLPHTNFDGSMEDLMFWKRKLTEEEKVWLWNNGNGRPDPLTPYINKQ